jgi:hypothetical protein
VKSSITAKPLSPTVAFDAAPWFVNAVTPSAAIIKAAIENILADLMILSINFMVFMRLVASAL